MGVSRRDWLRGSAMLAGMMASPTLATAAVSTTETVEIWPGGVGPGSKGAPLQQKMVERTRTRPAPTVIWRASPART